VEVCGVGYDDFSAEDFLLVEGGDGGAGGCGDEPEVGCEFV